MRLEEWCLICSRKHSGWVSFCLQWLFQKKDDCICRRDIGTFDTPYIDGWMNFVWYDKATMCRYNLKIVP